MYIVRLITALLALVLAVLAGREFYKNSQFLGMLGVIVGSFAAALFGLHTLFPGIREVATMQELWSGFGLSSLIALLSLIAGSYCQEDPRRSDKATKSYVAAGAEPMKQVETTEIKEIVIDVK